MGGATWQGDGSGIGRDLRSPEQRPGYRAWPFAPGDTPGSDQLDAALDGTDEKPVDRPVPARSTSRLPAATGSAAPWIHNPPGTGRVHRTGGSAQLRRAVAQPGDSVRTQLGREYFAPDGPAAPAGPVCICGCGQTVPPGKPGKVTVDATHRRRASRQRARAADLLN